MPERENEIRGEQTAAQLRQEIITFVEKAEFGTIQFEAISDYVDFNYIESLWRIEAKNLQNRRGREQDTTWEESSLRIAEGQMIDINNKIRRKRSSSPGYSRAFSAVERIVELKELAEAEAEDKFPDDKDQKWGYIGETISEIDEMVSNIVWTKRNAS